MNLKAKFESHSVTFVLMVAAGAFASGWGGHYAVQSAAGRISVSMEAAKRIDSIDAERQAYIARIIQLEAMNRQIESDLSKAKAAAPSGQTSSQKDSQAPSRRTLPSLQSKVQQQVESTNEIPVTVGEILLEKGPVQTVKINSDVKASVDYIVKPGYTVRLWIRPSGGNCAYLYEPSPEISGSGRITRVFTSASSCILDELVVLAEHGEAGSGKRLKTVRPRITFSP